MEIKLRPVIQSVTAKRECPSGALTLSCSMDFRSPGGLKVATRTVNEYGTSLKVEWSEETMAAGRAFIKLMTTDVENALEVELSQNLAEEKEG